MFILYLLLAFLLGAASCIIVMVCLAAVGKYVMKKDLQKETTNYVKTVLKELKEDE